MQYIIGNG